jgi:uncharacterized protein YdaU (DUF1376 family)
MKRFPWLSFKVQDHIAGTRHLTSAQRGAYTDLLWAMWERDDCYLPLDTEFLRGITGVHAPRWERVWNVIKPLFIIDGNRVTQKRLQAELQYCLDKSAKNTKSARLGGLAKARRQQPIETYDPQSYTSMSDQNPLQNNESILANGCLTKNNNNKEEKKTTPIPLNDNLPENEKEGLQKEPLVELSASQQAAEFETFWSAYPRKESHGAARLAYVEALKRASAAELLAGAKRYAKAVAGKDQKYTKGPTRWLNEDGWRDELAQPSNVAAGPWKEFPPAEPPRVSTPEELAARDAQVKAVFAARDQPTKAEMELKIKRLARETRALRHHFTVLPEKERKALGEEEAV